MTIASHGSTKKPEDIIGRKTEMEQYWRILEKQSIMLSSVRRMGKTCILRKMCANPAEGWIGVEYFVQGKTCPEEFTYDLVKILQDQSVLKKTKWKSFSQWAEKNLGDKDFGSFKIPRFKGKWKELLTDIIKEVAESKSKVVIMIDELPLMLWELQMKGKEEAETAMELLNTLRTLRETYEADSHVRFIFCGSIGMNLVLQKFKKDFGYMGQPINNMAKVTVLAMNDSDGKELCEYFLEGYPQEVDQQSLINRLLQATDNIPFYIEMAFGYFEKNFIDIPTVEDVNIVFEKTLNEITESDQYSHFSERIDTYYEEDERKVAYHILNFLCQSESLKPEQDVINYLNTQSSDFEEKTIKDTLKKLWEDLCIERVILDDTRHYKFKYNLIRRWWKINKA